jgi:hypothetical protein
MSYFKQLLLIACLAMPFIAAAQYDDVQRVTFTFSTNKKTGKTDIAAASKTAAKAAMLDRTPYYELTSYYDGPGEYDANIKDAETRLEAVLTFLATQGLDKASVIASTADENSAFAKNTSVTAAQRGKHVELAGYRELVADMKTYETKPSMLMLKDGKKDTSLVGKNGVTVNIAAGTIFAEPAKPVRIVIKDLSSRFDMMMNNQTTRNDDKVLEAASLVFVTCDQGGKPASLAKPLTYQIPNAVTGANYFKGSKGKDGDQNWSVYKPGEAPAAGASSAPAPKTSANRNADGPRPTASATSAPAAAAAPEKPVVVSPSNGGLKYEAVSTGWQIVGAPINEAAAKTRITVASADKGEFKVVFKNKRAVMKMRYDKDGGLFCNNLPEGEPIYIFGTAFKDGKNMISLTETTVKTDQISVSFELATPDKMAKLESLFK